MKSLLKLSMLFIILIAVSCQPELDQIESLTVNNNKIRNPKIDFDAEEAKKFSYPDIDIDPIHSFEPQKSEQLIEFYKSRADTEEGFRWSMMSDFTLWSATVAGNNMLEIGFIPQHSESVVYKDGDYASFNKARNYTIEFVLREMRKMYPNRVITVNDLEIDVPEYLPILWIKIPEFEIVSKLRKLSTVRYVEPLKYDVEHEINTSQNSAKTSSLSSCPSIPSSHYQTPFLSQGFNSKVSWHYYLHNIPLAWNQSTGRNVAIGIVDTGIFKDQDLLKYPKFNAGLSTGRSITSHNLAGNLIDIGHGTGVTGVAAGPVNNDGAITGVAYQSSIVSYRVSSDPWIGTSRSKNNFIEAVEKLANNYSVKVINMSVGRFAYRSSMEDAVNYAYARGKLMICSSGITGNSGGLYPAKFTNTIAVTAVPFRSSDPLGTNLTNLWPNPYGSYVHFAAYMKRESDNAKALSLPKDNPGPCSDIGSSKAAAMVSGIAALVWSANPYLTRDEVVEVLKESASYDRYQGVKNGNFGYGIIDAQKAVADAIAIGTQCRDNSLSMTGTTSMTKYQTGQWSASLTGSCSGAVTYKWYNSSLGPWVQSTSSTYSSRIGDGYSNMTIRVEATKNGTTLTRSKYVACTDCIPEGGECQTAMMTASNTGSSLNLRIAPVPCELDPMMAMSENQLQLIDSESNIVYSRKIYGEQEVSIDRELAPGTYTLQLIYNGGFNEQVIDIQ